MIFRREFAAYFSTPLAAVFLAVFVAVSSGMTFFVSNFFDRGQADLSSLFSCRRLACACGLKSVASARLNC